MSEYFFRLTIDGAERAECIIEMPHGCAEMRSCGIERIHRSLQRSKDLAQSLLVLIPQSIEVRVVYQVIQIGDDVCIIIISSFAKVEEERLFLLIRCRNPCFVIDLLYQLLAIKIICALGFNEDSVATFSIKEENAMGVVFLTVHQISVLDDFGSVLKGLISHLLEPLAVEGNDFLHFNLHRLIAVSLVIQRSVECDFLHRHHLSFFLIV